MRAILRSKVDIFVPHTLHVTLGIGQMPSSLEKGACNEAWALKRACNAQMPAEKGDLGQDDLAEARGLCKCRVDIAHLRQSRPD